MLAEPAEHGGVLITGSVQNLFSTRRSVAAALKLDLNRVEIIQATLGGSFGGKDEVMTSMCCRAALLALATGKPVKMVNSREESMLEVLQAASLRALLQVGREEGRLDHGDGDQVHCGRRARMPR